ncbi:AhpC/TSA antioxidant enzyme-domain-containing protein [Aspergillus avenaceus]|uniref:AhpC/TSA antioxidant enzyme-domain-containing protein n=1 Tax=Aspergillus avenaceus TaxID=36643 RepID=A0A5N6TWI3_ASPAV|nr:AhpC/TSA antioxidant enzyme-domain-containing protein [Aspergillus avenaceus]
MADTVTDTPSVPATNISNPPQETDKVVAQDQLPSASLQQQVGEYTVFDRHGKTLPFKNLYSGPQAATRVLVIFVRHFFCGSCQEFLRSLSETIRPECLPANTSVAVIGCGDPGLIDTYAAETGCPFNLYADPSRKLYDDLGMVSSLALGPRPQYIRKGFAQIVGGSIWQALKQIPSGLAAKGGESSQNGGEFLFEPSGATGEKEITWCHRMQNTRDHTEISTLAHILNGAESQSGIQSTVGTEERETS